MSAKEWDKKNLGSYNSITANFVPFYGTKPPFRLKSIIGLNMSCHQAKKRENLDICDAGDPASPAELTTS